MVQAGGKIGSGVKRDSGRCCATFGRARGRCGLLKAPVWVQRAELRFKPKLCLGRLVLARHVMGIKQRGFALRLALVQPHLVQHRDEIAKSVALKQAEPQHAMDRARAFRVQRVRGLDRMLQPVVRPALRGHQLVQPPFGGMANFGQAVRARGIHAAANQVQIHRGDRGIDHRGPQGPSVLLEPRLGQTGQHFGRQRVMVQRHRQGGQHTNGGKAQIKACVTIRQSV